MVNLQIDLIFLIIDLLRHEYLQIDYMGIAKKIEIEDGFIFVLKPMAYKLLNAFD